MTQEDKAKAYDELIKDIKRIIFNYEGGELYNLLEKKGELNQLEPRFNIGDVICDKSCTTLNKITQPNLEIIEIKDGKYYCYNGLGIILLDICQQNCYELVSKKVKQKPEDKSAIEAINEEKVDNANKVEPKFKVGDWITNSTTKPVQISSIEDGMYFTHNDTIGGDVESIDKEYHLWTIDDAKAGDIIVTGIGNIFIFKGIRDYTIFDYCGLYYGKININASHVNEANATDFPTNYTPAVKEQRDLLIKALNDAGYDFDFKKKELKKLNTNKKVILHPFDKVLVRNTTDDKWEAELIVNLSTANKYYYRCIVSNYKMCVPYNKNTADLLNTSDNSPIDYKIKFSKEFKEK